MLAVGVEATGEEAILDVGPITEVEIEVASSHTLSLFEPPQNSAALPEQGIMHWVASEGDTGADPD